MALIKDDLYDEGARFMYGGTKGPYGVVSSFQFAAPSEIGMENRLQLVDRITKQLMSSVGYAIGIPRCYTPDCARAFPSSVQEHDAKRPGLCVTCEQAFRRYIETGENPEGGGEYVRIGQKIMASGGDIAEALQWITRGIDSGCRTPAAYTHLGFCHVRMSNAVAAAAAYTKAVDMDWNVDVGAHIFLGNVSLAAGSNDLALAHYTAAHQIDTNSIPARVSLITAQRNTRRFKDALSSARELHKQAPTLATGYELAGDCLFAGGDVEAAISVLAPGASSAT